MRERIDDLEGYRTEIIPINGTVVYWEIRRSGVVVASDTVPVGGGRQLTMAQAILEAKQRASGTRHMGSLFIERATVFAAQARAWRSKSRA